MQAYRTATVNMALKVGTVTSTIEVQASALTVNAVDTTNGYILEKNQIDEVPLPTGSFTGLAILSPGVNAELESGTGANNGMGNQPIWSNGQRDTSNTFMFNGVDASNLFNGKSTSSVSSGRVVNATGLGGAAGITNTSAEPIQSTSAPYLAIGQALPTPAPETIQEFRVNTSMYDAQQGSTSGAHVDMSTASGTNSIHGSLYDHHGTSALNAAPYFYNADGNIPAADKVPGLHRDVGGFTLGGPVLKNRVFGFISYQHIHDADQELGSSRVAVPPGLTDDRSPAALAQLLVTTHPSNLCPTAPGTPCNNFPYSGPVNAVVGNNPGEINPLAFGILNYTLPNGQFLVPSPGGFTPTINFPENTFTKGTALFAANQAVANLDWTASPKETVALKYYYQLDPTTAPYAYSGANGFPQHLDAGSQVASITNTQTLKPNLSVVETFGFIREKIYSSLNQPFTPAQFSNYVSGLVSALPASEVDTNGLSPVLNTFGSTYFPGFTILDDYGNNAIYNSYPVTNAPLTVGEGSSQSQGAFTGVFQNRFMPSANAIWNHGKHTVTFGGNFTYTQLDTRDDRTDKGIIGFSDFSQFLQGLVTSYTTDGYITTSFLQGNANRYYRANDVGAYLQDKYQLKSNVSVTLGARFDYHGGMTEKYGRLFNFDPARYVADNNPNDVFNANNGIIIAGNNPLFPTKGVSDSTLTGRQWGLGPRIGIAWSPTKFDNKVVVRTGWGMYYDRGELFAYLSPGFATGVIPGGPFGVAQTPPFVNNQVCTDISTYYEGFIPECNPSDPTYGGSFNNPWGATLGPAPTGNPALIPVPTTAAILNGALSGNPPQPFTFGDYNRANKLPYTMNQTLDIEWMPKNNLLIDLGYVGNLGRHGVIPIPFNQALIATPTNPVHGQNYSYGYTVQTPGCTTSVAACAITLPDGTPMLATAESGNVDLRVPYVGISSQAESYTAAGISAYNALQTHIEKRLGHGVQFGFSYTYSHATDEQSGLGLFFNGNNPLNLRSAYGSSDFDRTHVINFTYLYQMPNFFKHSWLAEKLANGWSIQGTGTFQSGQAYSIIDFSGAVGSVFYGTSDGITNPIVPLSGCTPSQAETGHSGVNPSFPALNASCFTVPLLNPGDLGGAIPANDPYETNFTSGERNIFRQPWQRRADISFVKTTQFTERYTLKYTFDIFNLTNTTSFDIPIDSVSQNLYYNDFPVEGTPALPTSCNASTNAGFYSCPTLSGLGITNKAIGGPRQIQMSLVLSF